MYLFPVLVDVRVPLLIELVGQSSLTLLSMMAVMCVVFPWFSLMFSIVMALFILLDIAMNKGVLETRKLENVAKSPVLQQLSSSMVGLQTIRGYQRQNVVINK